MKKIIGYKDSARLKMLNDNRPFNSILQTDKGSYYEIFKDANTYASICISVKHYNMMRMVFPFYCFIKAVDLFLFIRSNGKIKGLNLWHLNPSLLWIKKILSKPDPYRDIVNLAGKVWKNSWGVYTSFWE